MNPRLFVLATALLGNVPAIAQSPPVAAAAKQAFETAARACNWSPEIKTAYLRYARAKTLADAAAKQPDELAGFIARCTARLDQAAKLPTAPDTKLYRLTLEKKATSDQRRAHQGGGRRPPVAGR